MRTSFNKYPNYSIIIVLFLCLFSQDIYSQEKGKIFLTAEIFQKQERITIQREWKYQPGNNKAWADPSFDDSNWEICESPLRKENLPISGFPGRGCFRIHIFPDSSLINKIFAFSTWQSGKTEIFLDGKLIKEIEIIGGKQINGDIGWGEIIFKEKREYILAVFFANPLIEKFHNAGFDGGFYFRMGFLEKTAENSARNNRENTISQILFTTLPLAFALLHLILFVYAPTSKANLYYALALILYAAATYMDYESSAFSGNIEQLLINLRIHRLINPFGSVFFLRFAYSLFFERLPKQFRIFVILLLICVIFIVWKPTEYYPLYAIVSTLTSIEIFRVIIQGIKRKHDGAKILAFGFFTLFFFSGYDSLLDLNIMNPIANIQNMYFFGAIGLFISTSIYLARDFARTSKRLLEQEQLNREKEIQRRLLEADNNRKTKELEDARNLQVSMLPKSIPELPNMEIAVFMKTATEVGGDYYDFFRTFENDLIIAIGDATGHGTKSGNMVSIIKSLLSASKLRNNFPAHFEDWSKIIKQMNLGNLFMGLTLAKVDSQNLKMSSAGMPPVYIMHSDSKTIEEIVLKSMPLGAAIGFPYKEVEKDLQPNDVIIFMSDGYLEQFNEKMEMLETDVFKNYLLELSDEPPKIIIDRLMEKSKDWMKDKQQTDDITFVVVRVG
jgi:serine phosphatase RsbU (regulator of sigma subunit)